MANKLSITARRDRDYRQNVTAAAAANPTADVEVLIDAAMTAESAILALTQAIQYLQEHNVVAPAAP